MQTENETLRRYAVEMSESVTYSIVVEALDEDQAAEVAEQSFLNAPDHNDFFVSCDRQVEGVELTDDPLSESTDKNAAHAARIARLEADKAELLAALKGVTDALAYFAAKEKERAHA